MKKIIWSIFSIFLSLFILLAWCSYPWSLSEKTFSTQKIINLEPKEMVEIDENPSVIKVLTWNLGFLYGEGSEGKGYLSRDKSRFEDALKKLVSEIKQWDPDIVFLQEIDFNSSRSHGINQAQYLALHGGYPYVAEVVSWDANYIPFPYWPIENHFGRLNSGGAILSRYPIENHRYRLLHKPLSNPWWYNLFYLHRYFQEVDVLLGSKKMTLLNLHLESFDKIDREQQVGRLLEVIKKDKVSIVAGDFNMVPKSATKKNKFYNQDDYENDKSYDLMLSSSFHEVIPDEIYALSENSYFTFPALKPDRRLDYIFYDSSLKMMRAEVLPSALSDHLPVRASFQIGSPKINPYSL